MWVFSIKEVKELRTRSAAGIFWVPRIFEDLCKSVRFASPQGGRARTGVEALLPPASPSSSFFS